MHDKAYLEEVIYRIHRARHFLIAPKLWSSPKLGFSYNNSLDPEFLDLLMGKGIIHEKRSNVICVLSDWATVAEGIIFTDAALYMHSPKNRHESFRVRYDEITRLDYNRATMELKITTSNNVVYYVDTPIWRKENIKLFLEISIGRVQIDEIDFCCTAGEKRLVKQPHHMEGARITGNVFSNVSSAAVHYGEDKFATPRGHGFAAERANHMFDKLTGKKAYIVGDNNAKYGADRIVDGVNIQTKYCRTGSDCVRQCFENGRMKYINADGSPMQIEVPLDKYDAAVQAMENRIRKGEVLGVTDPGEAKKIIRKGHFTYEQARNIARFGTVDSIKYDAVNGAIVSTYALGISSLLSFAVSIWNGDDMRIALKNASFSGLKVGGTSFITAIMSSQLSKAGLNSLLVGSSEAAVGMIGPKASALLVNAFRSGSNIYGAAALKSAAKMLRSNAVTAGVSFVVLSSADVLNIFRGRISGSQLFKNLTNTAASVGGGTAGWIGGASAGAAIGSAVPMIGTAIGGIVGGLAGAFAGGTLANKASDAILSQFIEDDAKLMVRILEEAFQELAADYLLSKEEAERIVEVLGKDLTGNILKTMFASTDRKDFAKALLLPYVEGEAANRRLIETPSTELIMQGLRDALEELADQVKPISHSNV